MSTERTKEVKLGIDLYEHLDKFRNRNSKLFPAQHETRTS